MIRALSFLLALLLLVAGAEMACAKPRDIPDSIDCPIPSRDLIFRCAQCLLFGSAPRCQCGMGVSDVKKACEGILGDCSEPGTNIVCEDPKYDESHRSTDPLTTCWCDVPAKATTSPTYPSAASNPVPSPSSATIY